MSALRAGGPRGATGRHAALAGVAGVGGGGGAGRAAAAVCAARHGKAVHVEQHQVDPVLLKALWFVSTS